MLVKSSEETIEVIAPWDSEASYACHSCIERIARVYVRYEDETAFLLCPTCAELAVMA
jgi:hypothetical protein